MLQQYDKRSIDARGTTNSVADFYASTRHLSGMLGSAALLSALRRLRDDGKTTNADLGRLLSLPSSRIAEIFEEKRSIKIDEMKILVEHFGLDGNSSAPANLDDLASEHGLAFVEEVDLALGMGASFLESQPEVIGTVPFRIDWLRGLFEGSIERLKVVRGRGDSMQPTILDGDLVLVDTAHRRIDDQDRIWAIAYGDLGMIRRVRVTPRGTWLLMPDNAVVRSDEVTDGEAHVIGRVIWIGRRI